MFEKVSIIMVNYNGAKYMGSQVLSEVLESFLKTDYPNFEFIFVDNCSSDNSIAVAEQTFKKYKSIPTLIVRNQRNFGFSGSEDGIKVASGKYIVLVNNDNKVIDPKWLKILLEQKKKNKNAVVFGKLLKWENPKLIDAAGFALNWAGYGWMLREGEFENKISEYEHPIKSAVWQVPVLFDKKLHEVLGEFLDKNFVIINDEIDSSLRIWLAGYKILLVPKVIMLHKRNVVGPHLPVEFSQFHGRKNTLMLMLKNYETITLLKWMPVTLIIYLGAIIYYSRIKRLDHLKAILKALLWTIKNLPLIIKKRIVIQSERKISDKDLEDVIYPFNLSEMIRKRPKRPYPR
ncbi:MAG: glycosyltransferase family 2 protein [Nitrososphaeria archaeon]